MANLEKKTKKELIEIISRKDSVEVSLRKDLEGIENNLKSRVAELIALKNEKDSLIKKHNNEIAEKNKAIHSYQEVYKDVCIERNKANQFRIEYQIACGILGVLDIGLLITLLCVL